MGLFLGDSEPSKIFVGDTAISKVFLGDTQVRPSGWKPGANTLFYASLNGNTNSEGTLNPTFNSQSGTITYPTAGNIQYAYLNSGKMIWDIGTPPTNTITFQARVKQYNAAEIAIGKLSGTWYDTVGIELYLSGSGLYVYTQKSSSWYGTGTSASTDTWYLLTGVKNGTTLYVYINGVLLGSVSCPNDFAVHNYLYIAENTNTPLANVKIGVSDIILEDKARTAQEIIDYYNLTKGNYGL